MRGRKAHTPIQAELVGGSGAARHFRAFVERVPTAGEAAGPVGQCHARVIGGTNMVRPGVCVCKLGDGDRKPCAKFKGRTLASSICIHQARCDIRNNMHDYRGRNGVGQGIRTSGAHLPSSAVWFVLSGRHQ